MDSPSAAYPASQQSARAVAAYMDTPDSPPSISPRREGSEVLTNQTADEKCLRAVLSVGRRSRLGNNMASPAVER